MFLRIFSFLLCLVGAIYLYPFIMTTSGYLGENCCPVHIPFTYAFIDIVALALGTSRRLPNEEAS